ncbi:Protein FAM151B, partial [Stegodyphus mimosarum]
MGHVMGQEFGPPIPIMAHPPNTTSDLSLDTWLDIVIARRTGKGVKLDFKSIETLKPSMKLLESHAQKLNFSLWLNADILSGPINSTTPPLPPDIFLSLCHQYFPNAVLSLGWTTYWFSTFPPDTWHYKWIHVRKMADIIRCAFDSRYPSITFPVRGIFASRSIEQLQ